MNTSELLKISCRDNVKNIEVVTKVAENSCNFTEILQDSKWLMRDMCWEEVAAQNEQGKPKEKLD